MPWFPIRSKLVVKYFLSYLLIFSLPLVVLGLTFYFNAVVNLQREIESSNVRKLQQVKDLLDNQMQGLKETAAKISFDPRLTAFTLTNGGYSAEEGIRELGRYKTNNPMADDVLLYFHGNDSIYSSAGSASLHVWTRSMYQFQNWNEEQFVQDINFLQQATLRPTEKIILNHSESKDMLTFLVPIPINQPYPKGTVLFLISESKLTNLISDLLGNFYGSVYILNDHNQILASQNSGVSLSTDQLLQLVKDSIPGIPSSSGTAGAADGTGLQHTTISGMKYSIVRVESAATGWTFAAVIPTNQFLSRVIEMKTLIWLILLSLGIVGCGSAVMLTVVQYRPVRRLTRYAREREQQLPEEGRVDEWTLIHTTMDAVYARTEALQERIYTQRSFVREQYLLNWLKGRLDERSDLEQVFQFRELQMTGKLFFVMVASLMKGRFPSSVSVRETTLNRLSHLLLPGAVCVGIELVPDGTIALIVNLEEPGQRGKQEAVANAVWELLRDQDIPATIAVGKTYRDRMLINRSYIEALAAADTRMSRGGDSLLFFEDINLLQESRSWYSVEAQIKFVQSLKQGDSVVARETLRVLFSGISEQRPPVWLLKCVCFDVINAVFKTLDELNLTGFGDRMKELAEFELLEELEAKLDSLVNNICEAVNRKKESQNRALLNNVLEFIKERYFSNGLSLEAVADHFHISASYLGRFIKEQTGNTFTDYVLCLRMDDVKRELCTTEKPIHEIIADAGYLNTSSFIRKFKKLEGVTPGEYRKLHAGS